ncbi:MAG: hypothetical protein QXJ20_02430 [Candidatus Aenigmatarchaeota archaeon]
MAKAIFIPSIGTGGAERVAVNLIKKLNFDYLILLDDTHIAYPIPLPMVIWRTFMIQIMLIEILSFNNLKAMAKGKALTF